MNRHTASRGFTLISVMIVVAIVGILAAIAYPSYIDQVRQSRRTEAISLLMRAANEQEQYFSIEQTYAHNMSDLDLPTETESGWYKVAVDKPDNEGDAVNFTIKAEPQKDQAIDECGTFYIDETGAKWVEGSSAGSDKSQKCW